MMDYSKSHIKTVLAQDVVNIFQKLEDFNKTLKETTDGHIEYLRALLSQIPQSKSGPIITKTPKVTRTRKNTRIQAIPEDDVVQLEIKTSPASSAGDNDLNNQQRDQSIATGRSRRKVSKKSDSIIPEPVEKKRTRNSQLKRTVSPSASTDSEDTRPAKKSRSVKDKVRLEEVQDDEGVVLSPKRSSRNTETEAPKDDQTFIVPVRTSLRKRSAAQKEQAVKKKVPNNETFSITTNTEKNDADEVSIYEDAIGKPIPIGNSTMNPIPVITDKKIMNATVVLETVQIPNHFDQTIKIHKNSTESKKKSSSGSANPPPRSSSRTMLKAYKEAMANKEFDELITDDESESSLESPVKSNYKKKLMNSNFNKLVKQNRVLTDDEDDDDDDENVIPDTPPNIILSPSKTSTVVQMKNIHKPTPLFSPFAKNPVKKRVEAFEQATTGGLNCPDSVDAPKRITRTKTRAMAAKENVDNEDPDNKAAHNTTITQQLARKSVAKAKKISLAKQLKNNEECKENKLIAEKMNKLMSAEKPQKQLRGTPMEKTKIQMPMSANRIHNTPNNAQPSYTKTLTGSRSKIVTSVDSFINPTRVANHPGTADKMEEKKRKLMMEEDARKKREETLRLQTEEKRRKRQEKELKNKLAREAKEKLNMQKRLKAEKEREEKAKLAQQMQEKMREEMEKKRLAQTQRFQEIEERRRQEEQQRLQRLQEQEEVERLLMEERRKEQEAEKRREAEARAQHQAALEAQKLKQQMAIAKAKKEQGKNQGPTSYVLDSEPDDDESDNECQPKHEIPYWAQTKVREAQLAMQRYIPQMKVFKFFGTRKCTPELTELFHGIERSKLKRTSSAIWKTPPRYSMMEP